MLELYSTLCLQSSELRTLSLRMNPATILSFQLHEFATFWSLHKFHESWDVDGLSQSQSFNLVLSSPWQFNTIPAILLMLHQSAGPIRFQNAWTALLEAASLLQHSGRIPLFLCPQTCRTQTLTLLHVVRSSLGWLGHWLRCLPGTSLWRSGNASGFSPEEKCD